MEISRERRERWERLTKNDPFNLWLRPQVTAPDGTLDLDALHAVAGRYGIDRREQYAHLNPGQVRMNLGNMLRKAVPPEEYGAEPRKAQPLIVAAPSGPAEPTADEPPLARASIRALLTLHAEVMEELRRREVVRTSNSPVGDYAELLFSTAFGWALENSSAAGHDATDKDGVRYQIKSRRLTRHNGSRQLSFLRRLPERKFDYLAAVLFDARYQVRRAIILPHEGLEARCRYSKHANGWLFRLEDSSWDMTGARDVTEEIRATAEAM
ncbi:hypothetical protein N0B44_26215 [Roseibacterium beibuensis]|uniref:hypothetical protein n=1 Tax=[Roseibacterium] beibuensis TaxID=1193142 RepID=UPI00217D787A|nr:hypothetical protein [Roseibacterium beibuensis]MCS6626421.1 hypothetical protein [Roseibacterium beibuensis]